MFQLAVIIVFAFLLILGIFLYVQNSESICAVGFWLIVIDCIIVLSSVLLTYLFK